MRHHLNTLSSFIVGLIFGAGLILAGMTDPSKVIGFLDLAGHWDPSLALVMGGAMHLPTRRDIDLRLAGGSMVFGIGWGMAGFCPGPALTALGTGNGKAMVFVAAMIAGMALFEMADRLWHAPRRAGKPS